MQPQTAQYICNLCWADANGNVIKPAAQAVMCPYDVALTGHIPVPDGTASGTEFDVPFTGLSKAATLICIQNATHQELNCAWGGNWAPHLPDGGLQIWAHPVPVVEGAITSLRFMLTQQQVGAGRIIYTVLGS